MKMLNTILVLAMGRSGHHAVIEWLKNGLLKNNNDVVLDNNCVNGWKEKRLICNKSKVYHCGVNRGVYIIKNIEDINLNVYWNRQIGKWDDFEKIICVVRSPRNWLASSIAADGWANNYLDSACIEKELGGVDRVKAYETYFLEDNIKNMFYIVYDKWVVNIDYRIMIANQLGIVINNLPGHCKFSSFSKNKNGYVGNRYDDLNDEQKNRFDMLFSERLKIIQEEYFE